MMIKHTAILAGVLAAVSATAIHGQGKAPGPQEAVQKPGVAGSVIGYRGGKRLSWSTSIPTADKISFQFGDGLTSLQRRRLAQSYDGLRRQLILARLDPRLTLAALSTYAEGGLPGLMSDSDLAEFDLLLPLPTIAEQSCMVNRLKTIQADVRRSFKVKRPSSDVVLDGPEPVDSMIRNSAFLAVSRYGRIIEQSATFDVDCRPGVRQSARKAAVWRTPIRINSTGNPIFDDRLKAALAELRARVPGLPIDDRTFPAVREETNFWVGRPDQYRVEGMILRCKDSIQCRTIGDLFADPIPLKDSSNAQTLLTSAYLARPYIWNGNDLNALVRVGANGHILEAGCGSANLGFRNPGHDGFGPVDPIDATLICLAEGMGASPGATADILPQGTHLKSIAIAQLKKLYS